MSAEHPARHFPSVAEDGLDQQHRRLLGLAAKIFNCVEQGTRGDENTPIRGEACHVLINDLFEASLEHFRCEEELLASLNYPLLTQHQKEHSKFIERLSQFLYAGIPGAVDMDGLCRYLADWMDRHKRGSDIAYSKFLQPELNPIPAAPRPAT